MPNHIINVVTLHGSKETIKKFIDDNIKTNVDEDENPFSFQTIIPRPKSLDIESSSRTEDAMRYITMTEEEKLAYNKKHYLDTNEKIAKFIEIGKTAISNKQKYGHTDWYGWDIANWGTKWDCYEVSAECSETSVKLIFQTAWATPTPIFMAMTKKYKDLKIMVEYADEDLGYNCGIMEFNDGSMELDQEGNYVFANKLWNYSMVY